MLFRSYAKENVITTHTVIRNREKGDAVLHAFYSSSLPVKARSYLLTHLYGSWARESQTDHTLLTHGSKSIESRKLVRTTHTENPAFMITLDSEAFDENYGEVIAGALAWSGNFRLNFEVDEFNVLNILAGVNPYASDYTLAKGESFTTPEMVYTYSFEGAGGASRNLHDWARNYGVWHGHTYAPTLLNSWEGAYFTFDAKTLTDMIDDASPAAGIKSYRRTDHGTDNLAYSTMGGRNFREPALRVTHADGDMNTELRYVSHATRTLADKNVRDRKSVV